MPRVEETEGSGDHEQIIEKEVVVQGVIEGKYEAYARNHVPERTMDYHLRVERPGVFIDKS